MSICAFVPGAAQLFLQTLLNHVGDAESRERDAPLPPEKKMFLSLKTQGQKREREQSVHGLLSHLLPVAPTHFVLRVFFSLH